MHLHPEEKFRKRLADFNQVVRRQGSSSLREGCGVDIDYSFTCGCGTYQDQEEGTPANAFVLVWDPQHGQLWLKRTCFDVLSLTYTTCAYE